MGAVDRVFRSRRPSQERPLAAIAAGLWKNGEQGIWLDASDLSTMFQDTKGSLPAYLPGQGQVDPPVGLMLDKRLGLGGETVVNGNFSDGTNGWAVSGAGVVLAPEDGGLKVTSAAPLGATQQIAGTVVGKWYRVTALLRVGSAASVSIRVVSGVASLGTTLSETQVVTSPSYVPVTCVFQATSGQNALYLRVGTTNSTAYFQAVSVREVLGNHAYQTTTTCRPTLSARYNAFLASEKFDDAYWTWQASFTSQKTTEITDPSGGFDGWKITSNIANAALSRAGLTGFRNPVFTMVAKAGTWTPSIMVRNATTTVNLINAPLTSGDFTNSYGKYSARDLGGGWKEMKIEITSGVAVTDSLIAYLGSTGAIPVGQYMYLLRADFRESGDGVGIPAYQRIVDANTYDTSGFSLYLRFDGVDDSLLTAAVDLSGYSSVLLMLAGQKQAETNCVALEFGTAFNTAGCFGVQLPNAAGAFLAAWGTGSSVYKTVALPAAPYGGLFSVVIDKSKSTAVESLAIRINGSSVAGTGAGAPVSDVFGIQPIYIARRTNASLPFKGKLYCALVVGGASPDATILKVERYLNSKARIY